MKACDTLIIGSSYTALGYAVAKGDTVIVEEREICDTEFYLPLRAYACGRIEPATEEGRALYGYYLSHGMFCEEMQNLNGFESSFCGYALEKGIEILLKSRVINKAKTSDGQYEVSLITPSGIIRLLAGRIIDMRPVGGRRLLTLLFSTADAKKDIPRLKQAFPDAEVEPAFFADRIAVKLEAAEDYLTEKERAYSKIKKIENAPRLIYTAPVFCSVSDRIYNPPTDACFKDPISAFDAGVSYALSEGGAV